MAAAHAESGDQDPTAGQQVLIGTPEEIIKEVSDLSAFLKPESWVFTFRRFNLPLEVCEKSMRLFAKEVLPFIHDLPVQEPHW